ncbi:SigB/SigF/SigG family RNA polymerase sigma factor [Nocardia goodfellowii]|uniref:RNA polymerase sigma-B factor n=1 Tax=Nocardia goodfellowii TaxID=882446 RepID=A0ABS4QDE1_9NOCA|nr:SigB/SigF/SigG family RNA polymerase sigma factor [Nocardia goodfellowii]MBP2189704.1 RNA polymerase sigma-B factor [Nocardia goodfellowii]
MTVSTALHRPSDAANPPVAVECDDYEHLEPALAELAALDPTDPRHRALRARIACQALPLADHIAQRYAGRGADSEDLVQVARVGLLQAIDRFDPTLGSSFLGYAIPTIMGEVRRYFRDHTWALRVGRRAKETRAMLGPATEAFAQRHGRMPTTSELATELATDITEITQATLAANCYVADSLDQTAADDSGAQLPLAERLGDDERCYGLLEEAMTVGPLIAELTPAQRQLLIWRYRESLTQAQIADRLGVSQMQVSRILMRMLTSLRERALGLGSAA